MRYIREQLIECTYKITHVSATIYPRLHTHLLSKLVPKLKSRKRSIIVLFNTQSIYYFINKYF